MLRMVTGTHALVLRAVRVRLCRDAQPRTSAGQRAGTRLLSTGAAVSLSGHPEESFSGLGWASPLDKFRPFFEFFWNAPPGANETNCLIDLAPAPCKKRKERGTLLFRYCFFVRRLRGTGLGLPGNQLPK